jgi:hypothetical protein
MISFSLRFIGVLKKGCSTISLFREGFGWEVFSFHQIIIAPVLSIFKLSYCIGSNPSIIGGKIIPSGSGRALRRNLVAEPSSVRFRRLDTPKETTEVTADDNPPSRDPLDKVLGGEPILVQFPPETEGTKEAESPRSLSTYAEDHGFYPWMNA